MLFIFRKVFDCKIRQSDLWESLHKRTQAQGNTFSNTFTTESDYVKVCRCLFPKHANKSSRKLDRQIWWHNMQWVDPIRLQLLYLQIFVIGNERQHFNTNLLLMRQNLHYTNTLLTVVETSIRWQFNWVAPKYTQQKQQIFLCHRTLLRLRPQHRLEHPLCIALKRRPNALIVVTLDMDLKTQNHVLLSILLVTPANTYVGITQTTSTQSKFDTEYNNEITIWNFTQIST